MTSDYSRMSPPPFTDAGNQPSDAVIIPGREAHALCVFTRAIVQPERKRRASSTICWAVSLKTIEAVSAGNLTV